VKARELRRILKKLGCEELRQRGSHLVVRCGSCQTVIPVHPGRDIPRGTLASIVRDLAPCLGPDWLKE
jgi:predicted RNA binding protein YcfA (HicA-like mRNA interferase family)